MGVYLNVYIEYRTDSGKDGDGKKSWELVNLYKKIREDNTLSQGGKEFKFEAVGSHWYKGSICNFFDDCESIKRRGLPDDLSPDLRNFFDKHKAQVEKTEYMASDWYWGYSWCTMAELASYVDKEYLKCIKDILESHTKTIACGIRERLDTILDRMDGNKSPERGKEDWKYEEESDLDYYLDEVLPSIIQMKEFMFHMRRIVDSSAPSKYLSEDDIRLVCFFD